MDKPGTLHRSGFARKRTLKAFEFFRREGAQCPTDAVDTGAGCSDRSAERESQEPKPDSGSSPLE